jgi:hypothetical protein
VNALRPNLVAKVSLVLSAASIRRGIHFYNRIDVVKTCLKRLINILIVLCINIAPTKVFGDLYQDGGSWLQAVGETSLKFVDPKLENGRLWLEGQLRFDDDWGHLYQSML